MVSRIRDTTKTREREHLIKEVTELRQRIAELERAETERRRLEEAFRESEEKYRRVVERANDGIAVIEGGIIRYANPRLAKMWGGTIQELIGTSFTDYIEPDELPAMVGRYNRRMKGEDVPSIYETVLRRKDGSQVYVEINAGTMTYQGKLADLVFLRDTTDRKQVAAELRKSRERYRTLLDNVDFGINLIGADHTILMVNAAGSKQAHKSASALIGKKCFREFEKRDVVCPNCPGVRAMASGKSAEAETVGIWDDGNRYNMRLLAFPVFGDDGTATGFIEISEDITERKRTEEALRQSEERYRTLVETMKVGLSSIDDKGVLTYVNEHFCDMLGYSPEEMIGHPTVDFYYYENEREAQRRKFAKRKVGMRDTTPHEVTWRTNEGRRVYSILSPTAHFDADGRYTGSFTIITDITERKQVEEALLESEEKYRELIHGMRDTAWVIDFNGNFIDMNTAAVEVLGYPREELLSMGPQDIDTTLDAEEIRDLIKGMPKDKMQVFETTHTTKDGKKIPVEIKSTLVTYQGRRAILSIARDITERRVMEEELRQSEERYRLLFENESDAVMVFDVETLKFDDANRAALELYGYSKEELLRAVVPDISAEAEKTMEMITKLKAGDPEGKKVHLRYHRKKDGTVFPVEITNGVFMSRGRQKVIGVLRDITERVRGEETIRRLAYHDVLTGLPNRMLFTDRLNLAMAGALRNRQKLAVMLLDLDYFKDINDTLGHGVGDQLLRSVGERLIALLRKNDTVSRMGGDEFFLLLPEVARVRDASTIARKVLEAFQEPFVLDCHEVHITTSIGYALYPDDGEDADTLLQNSDIAMYHAKQEGRNTSQRYTVAMKPKATD